MLEKLKSLGLTWKFAVIVLAALTLVCVILLTILHASLDSRLDALYGPPKVTGVFVAELLADELKALAKQDVNSLEVQQHLQQTLDSYYKVVYGMYNVRYLFIQDGAGTVLADTFKDIAPGWLATKNTIDGKTHCEPWKSNDGYVYHDCAVPLKMGDAGVGAVRTGILQRDAEESFTQKLKAEHVGKVFGSSVLVTIFLILLVTVGLTFVFWFFVIRRILFLTDITQKMSYGELGGEVPKQSQDEIGSLEETLEDMRTNLRDAIERLKERLKRR